MGREGERVEGAGRGRREKVVGFRDLEERKKDKEREKDPGEGDTKTENKYEDEEKGLKKWPISELM